MTPSINSSCSVIKFGLKQAFGERLVLPVQIITFALLIFIFASLFKVTPFEQLGEDSPLNSDSVIWYFIITELIIFAGGSMNFSDVRNDIASGGFVAGIQRPVSYIHMKILIIIGNNIFRSLAFIFCGLGLGLVFTDNITISISHILLLILSAYIGMTIYSISHFTTAMFDVWGNYARPALWILQKFAFLLGGLVIPLQIYPQWLQNIAFATPYPAILNLSGRYALSPTTQEIINGFAVQFFWLFAVTLIALFIQRLAVNKIMREGN